jgi:hypothetical protein
MPLIRRLRAITFTDLRAEMRQTSVSHETNILRLLPSQKVSHRITRPASETARSSHLARIYTLLNEDRSRKPADIQRLTGIPKATVYRLVERYHRENPVIDANITRETVSDDAMSSETETAS